LKVEKRQHQGCQMVHLQNIPKISLLWYFRVLCNGKFWYILRIFGIFIAIWHILWSFANFFPVLVCWTKKNLASLSSTQAEAIHRFVDTQLQPLFANTVLNGVNKALKTLSSLVLTLKSRQSQAYGNLLLNKPYYVDYLMLDGTCHFRVLKRVRKYVHMYAMKTSICCFIFLFRYCVHMYACE
jgi:hypothetical protein